MREGDRPQVLILGGGFAGLETAFYLRSLAGERVGITLVSDRDHFVFRPNTIYIPFGTDPGRFRFPIAGPCRRRGIEFVQGKVVGVDPGARAATLEDGRRLAGDYLVVATGAGMRPGEIPGLAEHAVTLWTSDDMLELRRRFLDVAEAAAAKRRSRVLFLVPPNNKCAGPLYEMVLMFDTWLRRRRQRRSVDVAWRTSESAYVQAFGPRLDAVVRREFERRGIEGRAGWVVDRVEPGAAVSKSGEKAPFDLLVSFPPYVASTPLPGLPQDERGFLKTVPETRQVQGFERVYAAGDAGDFPVKQAFLAFLQADVVAERIAGEVLGRPSSLRFSPTSLCVMEQFDQATFAQVPLRTTGLPERPVEVDPGQAGLYRVGTNRTWRMGKKLLGVYLPWRFRRGLPFHRGAPWTAMNAGLKVMSRLMAR